ncbi:RNA-directed DNA polymerase, eukaryota [Tanacetum coccineum]|uniref:RNA-directed DNA polymerase, eukaryota n=1 Tax=Tanacetum coccineum TaxID=301880 RepID=A0ABQ5D2L0_9ASTR
MNFLSLNIQGLGKKAKKEWVKDLCHKNKVNFLTLQETKMEKMDMFCIKKCWGNMAFDYVHSDAVGNSGGILCVWDPNSFYKESVTISDSFVMIRGVWRATGLKYMIIAVYAPHEMKGKYLLWDYLQCEIKRWDGETVVTGDFNEVRHKSERFGTMFYAHEAKVFNTFIADSGLVEVSLGGSKFTWCHKSGSKMSKLDRFHVSKNLLNTSPNINAITLARYLSDHRPILLREISYDYGPIPFKVFHYWFDMNGFNNLVEVAWKEYPGNDSNAIRYFMGKLKFLKSKIREWNVTRRLADNLMQFKLIKDLENLDAAVDRGEGKDEISCIPKSKSGWAVEGDENSKFFHGMLNKKRSLLNVRGVLVDGIWVDNPHEVKNEFFEHFSSRFQHPGTKDATIVNGFFLTGEVDSVMSSSYKGSILVNGVNHGGLNLKRSLTQWGDPLSPFLFILVMESLHLSFQRVVDAGLFQGINIGEGLVNISHMFYADDAVFVGQWCDRNILRSFHVL